MKDFQRKFEGTFLWVSFMAEDLAKRIVADIINSVSESLPNSLHEVYERILLQMDSDDRSIIQRRLRWVVFSPLALGRD